MATNDSLDLALPRLATIRFYGDLQRFGRRFDLNIKTAAEGLHALFLQIPNLKQQFRDGWYQIRISGSDVDPSELHQRVHEPLMANAVIHIVPRIEGAKTGGISIYCRRSRFGDWVVEPCRLEFWRVDDAGRRCNDDWWGRTNVNANA